MPSSSEAQRKFFSLVRAVQKGDVPPSKVTSNVRQAAKDTSAKDAQDLASKKEKGAPERIMDKQPKSEGLDMAPQASEQPREGISFFDVVGKYNEYGNLLKRDRSLSELAQQLADIAEYAEYTLTSEHNDWFDQHTIKRNLKEMQAYAKEFAKIALEADTYQQRMTALYDDMGRILERYFDIYDQRRESDDSKGVMGVGHKTYGAMGSDEEPMEAVEEPMDARSGVDRRKPEPHWGNDANHGQPDRRKTDRRNSPHYGDHPANRRNEQMAKFSALTEKAIQIAKSRFTEADGISFASLPKQKQAEVAWRFVTKEDRMLGRGMSKAGLQADTDQSDREYIAKRQQREKQQGLRCAHCGLKGKQTGHQDCQYPQNNESIKEGMDDKVWKCQECGKTSKKLFRTCPKCHSTDIDLAEAKKSDPLKKVFGITNKDINSPEVRNAHAAMKEPFSGKKDKKGRPFSHPDYGKK